MTEVNEAPPGVDPTTPSPARLYDYYLGGVDNYPVDREAAQRLYKVVPELPDAAWANRGFHQRATRWMAAKSDIRQFIDIGAGLPTQNNTHLAARKEIPNARVLYVDNDPLVRAHAKALLTGAASTRFITADSKPPAAVQAFLDLYASATERIHLRTKAEVERFLAGLDIVPPYEGAGGVVTWMGEWGAEDPHAADSDGSRWGYGAVGRLR